MISQSKPEFECAYRTPGRDRNRRVEEMRCDFPVRQFSLLRQREKIFNKIPTAVGKNLRISQSAGDRLVLIRTFVSCGAAVLPGFPAG